MTSGDITDEYDERKNALNEAKPVCGFKLELVVADGTKSKSETIQKNVLLTDIYFWGPQLATAGKTAELILEDEDDNVIYSFGACDFSSATAASRKHDKHEERGIMNDTTIEVEVDENVTGAKTFYVTFRGL